ncbi:chorismate-binding protein [Phytomonospora sp. NPDC050363]|uniref:chorismate-binding protein n=1 Tax=Phytomonospora sp. NPDC050363 TaxID=3155642 RepID=UPI0033D02C1A
MITLPTSVQVPAVPSGCRGRLRERATWTWRLADGADPAELVTALLNEHGLGTLPFPDGRSVHDPRAGTLCGAALVISATAGAVMVGGTTGKPSPAPAVPDIAVVVYEHGPPAPRPPVSGPEFSLGVWRDSWDPAEHAGAVSAVREAIGAGDVYQVNLVGHARARYTGDPSAALARVASVPEARYAGGLAVDGWALACASPEQLITVEGDLLETGPIKGTRPGTEAGRAELLASVKERAEHVMIVDLERNDLAHVARPGSIEVAELFAVRRWRNTWHAESTIRARLDEGATFAGLLRAVCPGGSVTGTPKLSALDTIAALEPVGRGPAMGAFGYLTPQRLDLGLTIRTVAADGEHLHLWAGGGITWRSDPDAEVAEAAAKAAPLRALLAG